MTDFLPVETLVIELLLVASLVAIAARRLRIPYTVALVVVGLVLPLQQRTSIELTPALILALFVPPLVFEAAFHISFERLRRDIAYVLILAVPGVVLTMAIVGLVVWAGTTWAGMSLPLDRALLFGALVSATDPVAVVALFRALGAPRRLTMLVESESLLNDGTAIVLFGVVLALVLPGIAGGGAPPKVPEELGTAAVNFVRVSLGGIGIGFALGWGCALAMSRLDDALVETTLTTVLAFGSYFIAESFGVSGVLAVVVAGMVTGTVGTASMSPTTHIVLFSFWDYLAFLANSLVFLLIGLQVSLPAIISNYAPILVAVLATVASRALMVYGASWLANLNGGRLSWPYQHVMFWGGLRGAVTLGLALSLPAQLPERDLMRVMAFGVVLFTLLIQGTSMGWLLDRLGIAGRDESNIDFERRRASVMAIQAAARRLQQLQREGTISSATVERMMPTLEARIQARLDAQRELLQQRPPLLEQERRVARREALRAERAMLSNLRSDGAISDQVHEELVAAVDAAMEGEPQDDSLDPFRDAGQTG